MTSMIARSPETAHPSLRDAPTSVYRYFDQANVLIYVGITNQGMGRNLQHNGKAEWWPLVARQEVDHLPSRPAALRREAELIRAHRPPFNKQHNPSYAQARQDYFDFVADSSRQATVPAVDLFLALDRRLPLDVVLHEPGRLLLRSRLSEGRLATSLLPPPNEAEVRGRSPYGRTKALTVQGPTVLIECQLRMNRRKGPVLTDRIATAEALMKWNAKSDAPLLRQIILTEVAL